MNNKTRYGTWIAAAGVSLQLIGLSWDALMHHFDPNLAGNEGVFSLTNPSHLLIMLGLGLTVGGVVWSLSGGANLLSRTAPALARLSSAALLLLVALSSGVALATGGVSGQHNHTHGTAAVAQTAASDLPWSDPLFVSLAQTLRDSGTETALTRLEQAAASDPKVLSEAHNYAHALGRFSFSFYGSPAMAFSRCRETFQSGCFHGVIEAYFIANPDVGSAEIASLCNTQIQADASLFLRFQCVHGLGHGLTMHFDHDLFKALTFCDYLGTDWDRQSCYGGVFMENVIFAIQPPHAGHTEGHQAYVKADDPQYPCDGVKTQYREQCYLMQTSVMLVLNGYDFAKAAQSCGRAPPEYISTCFKSLGRDISGFTLRDTGRSIDLCQQGPAYYRSFCYVGVVKNFIDVTWRTDQALEFCARVPVDGKDACYQAVGEQIAGIYPDLAQRTAECARVEPAYVGVCARGARIT